MIALIQALLVVVGLIVTLTAQGASSYKGDDRTGYTHDGNTIKASSTPTPSARHKVIRKENERALAVASPSPEATIYARTTPVPPTSLPFEGGYIALLVFGVLGFLGYKIIARVDKGSRLPTFPATAPPVTALSVDDLQFQRATLMDLGKRVIPHYYHLSGFLPNKSESVIWAFHGVRHYIITTHSEWVGRSGGLNVRVARGVWIHSGASHGHKVQHSSVDYEVGTLVFTTTALCFVGDNSIRIPFSHILALNTYSDGFSLHTDYARNSERIFGDMHPDNVTFLKMALSLLHADPP